MIPNNKHADPNCGNCGSALIDGFCEADLCESQPQRMPFIYDDGGRQAAGYRGNKAGDCVCRAISIVTGDPYSKVYDELAAGSGSQRASKHNCKPTRSARNGIFTTRKWFKDYMRARGFTWVPTMGIGTGCKVHLVADELPMGRIICAVSKHYVAVLDRVIHDTFDSADPKNRKVPNFKRYWATGSMEHTEPQGERCVYGYWVLSV